MEEVMRDAYPTVIYLTPEQLKRADKEAHRRDEENAAAGLKDYGSAALPGRSKQQNRYHGEQACRSELAVALHLGREWTGEGGHPRVGDVAGGIEVKWSRKPVLRLQMKNPEADYFACTGDGMAITILGHWVFDPIQDKADYWNEDLPFPCIEIPADHLFTEEY